MSNRSLFIIGILGVSLFVIASVLGGFQFDDYDPIAQYISETMAVGTTHGEKLRFLGYIPSGILLTLFSFLAIKKFPKSTLIQIGFIGLAVFYGMATIVVGIFPCDQGCNKELINPSISQLIHNITGMLTYLFVPISIILISIGLIKTKHYLNLSKIGISCGLISIAFIWLMISQPLSNYVGLFQRIIESLFVIWIIGCAIVIKKGLSK
jgi:hypothetical protein